MHYISAGDGIFAIYEWEEKISGIYKTMYYIHKDYLGSFETITDNNGQVLEKLSFDPWGRRRNATDWTYDNVPTSFLFDRGYTGHEHLDNFDLINMNGRVYDPWLGRMLSPDPFLQAPGNSQSYNRYSYAYNNPLKYTDPSGYTERLSIVPGSGNHWSDPFRGEYGNYMLMSRNTFNNYYGAGSTDIVEQIWLNPDALKKWKKGELTLEQIRDDGGFEVDYSITYESDWNFNNGNKTLPVIERISKWVSVGEAGGGYQAGVVSQSEFHSAFTQMENIGINGGYFVSFNSKTFKGSDGNWYAKTSATAFAPCAEQTSEVSYFGITEVIVGGEVISRSNFIVPSDNNSYFITQGHTWLGNAYNALPAGGNAQLRITISYNSYQFWNGNAYPVNPYQYIINYP